MEYEGFFKNECYAIQGAIFEVYKMLGCGFLEAVYQESLELEMNAALSYFRPQLKTL